MKFEEVQVDKYWKYDEEWCEKNIKNKHDLNRLCKHKDAEYDVCWFLYYDGSVIHTNIKWLNAKISKLNSYEKDKLSTDEIKSFKSSLMRPGYYWSVYSDTHLKLEMVNYELAPADVISPIKGLLDLLRTGTGLHEKIEAYLDRLEQEIEIYEQQKGGVNSQYKVDELSRWEKIELRHVKAEEGFVYILSNPLMPGVYKIGFTARNPDERAKEISIKISLPMPFKVEKYWRTQDPYIVEQRIHSELKDHLKAGEYFEVELGALANIIENHIVNKDKMDQV